MMCVVLILLLLRDVLSQGKKLKNWYIQEYTTGTTFGPNIKKTLEKISDDDNVKLDMTNKQATVYRY